MPDYGEQSLEPLAAVPVDKFKVTYVIEHEVTVQGSLLAVALWNEYRAAYARSIDQQYDLQRRVVHASDAKVHFDALAVLLKDKITREDGEPKVMDAEFIPK